MTRLGGLRSLTDPSQTPPLLHIVDFQLRVQHLRCAAILATHAASSFPSGRERAGLCASIHPPRSIFHLSAQLGPSHVHRACRPTRFCLCTSLVQSEPTSATQRKNINPTLGNDRIRNESRTGASADLSVPTCLCRHQRCTYIDNHFCACLTQFPLYFLVSVSQ